MSAKQKGKPRPQTSAKPAAPRMPPAAPEVTTQTFEPGFWRRHWLPALLLMALAFALYGQAIRFGYVLDDEMTIWNNAYVQKGVAGVRDIFAYDSFMGYFQDKQKLFLLEGGRYRPLSLATFALEVSLFGKPGPELAHISHFINILLYGFTGILLFRILLGLFPLAEKNRWWFSAAFLGAALFVLHPLHIEAVANIKGRDEILALLFSLGALYASLKMFDGKPLQYGDLFGVFLAGSILLFHPLMALLLALGLAAFFLPLRRKASVFWGTQSFILLFLGLLSKENAITFVAVIPLTAWFFARVSPGRAFTASLPLLGAALLFVIIRYNALGFMVTHGRPSTDLMNNPFLGMSAGEKLATTFLTLGWYLKLLVYPFPLTHDYYPYQVPRVGWTDWRALLSLAIYLGMAAWALLKLPRRNVPAYAIAFYLLTLSIVSNLFVSVGTFMNERFLYTPSVAFCLLLGWLMARQMPAWLKEKPDHPGILSGGLAVLFAAFFVWVAIGRVPDWESKLTLNTSAVKNSPNSARAHCFYAVALYDEVLQAKDKKAAITPDEKIALADSMEAHILRAVAINPNYGAAWQMLPGVSFARFDAQRERQQKSGGAGPQMDRLFNDFNEAIDKAPNNTEIKRFTVSCVEYLATSGGNPNKIIAFCYNQGYERYYKKMGDAQTALKFLEAAVRTQNEDERLFNALAEIYQKTGNAAKAQEMLQRAAVARTIDPGK
ncbi:MAG: tetratricopeptide repeat protein [Saprospiraceae bacterium]|nr:tetratricopeptide repeat protein [Saprospiraceae bacterium]